MVAKLLFSYLNAEKYCLFRSDGETRVAAHQANAAREISVYVFLD